MSYSGPLLNLASRGFHNAQKMSSCLAGLRSSSSFATALASMPMVDSLMRENAFLNEAFWRRPGWST